MKAKQSKANQSKAKQSKAKQNNTIQNKTKQNKTKQNKTKQSKTKPNKTKQNKTKQSKTIRLFGVYLRSDDMSLDESTMTYSCRPLPQATYEVILPHPCSIRLQQKYEPLQESNPEPLCTESSPVTARPGF